MIVNYSPALIAATKNQRKPTVRLVSRSLQMPAPNRQRCIVAQDGGFEIRKRQRTHLLARVIILLIAIMYGLPAAREGIAGNKGDISVASITIHVAFNITTIPGLLLCVKHGAHSGNGSCVAF